MKTLMVSLWDPSDDGDDDEEGEQGEEKEKKRRRRGEGEEEDFLRDVYLTHCFSILYVQRYLSISADHVYHHPTPACKCA